MYGKWIFNVALREEGNHLSIQIDHRIHKCGFKLHKRDVLNPALRLFYVRAKACSHLFQAGNQLKFALRNELE